MPKLIHLVVCRNVVIDMETNNASLQSLVEEIQIPKEAIEKSETETVMAAGELTVFAYLSWEWPSKEDPRPIHVELQLKNPKGHSKTAGSSTLSHESGSGIRAIFKMQAFPIAGAGIYAFDLHIHNELAGTSPSNIDPPYSKTTEMHKQYES